MSTRIRVLVAHNERLMFEGLVAILGGYGELEVLGVAISSADTVEKAKVLAPDVLLMDMQLAGAGGPETCERVLAAKPAPAVLFLSADDSADSIDRAQKAGAADFLSTGVATHQLVASIQRVAGRNVGAGS